MIKVAAALLAVALAHSPGSGPDGTASMHGDAGASDTTPYAGPGANPQPAQTVTLPAVCPTILAGADGVVQALCTEYVDRAPSLYLLDPETLLPLARRHLSAGALLGGVYAYVNDTNQLVTVDGTGAVLWLGHRTTSTGWEITQDRAVPVKLPSGDAITTVAPGYDRSVWFATAQGRAGFVTPAGTVRFRTLGAGNEAVANSIATSASGVAVTTDHATYLLRASAGSVHVVWRRAYDRGTARKPGQLSQGSGSTPTFFGPHTGHDYVVITDNARPQERLLVYRTDTGAQVCSTPTFDADNSGTENSPLAWGRSIYLGSTYGYPYPAQATSSAPAAVPASADFAGGMQRFDLTERAVRTRTFTRGSHTQRQRFLRVERRLAHAEATHRSRATVRALRHRLHALRRITGARITTRTAATCASVWKTRVASAAVPRLSRSEGVIYTTERGAGGLTWSLDRISPTTGAVLSKTLIGVGPTADTLQMVGTILPDRTLLQGTITGLVGVRASE